MAEEVLRPNPILKSFNAYERELVGKYILLGTLVYEWVQRFKKLQYSLTDYIIKKTAQTVADIIEIDDFKANATWVWNFKKRFDIKCVAETSETPEALFIVETAINDINIYDVAKDFRAQNKFPESINKIYDRKFENTNNEKVKLKRKQYDDLYKKAFPIKKLRNQQNDIAIEIYDNGVISDLVTNTTNEESKVYETIEITDDRSEDSIINLENQFKNEINISTMENISKSIIYDCGVQLTKKACTFKTHVIKNVEKYFVTNQVNYSTDLSSIFLLNEMKRRNSHKIEIFDPVINYEQALKHLKVLEEFALLKCNFRAINFINNLEEIFSNELKKQTLGK